MQLNSGLYRLLSAGFIYNLFQRLLGSHKARSWFAKNVWKCSSGDRILDIGCGTGEILDYLPVGVDYYGFDISEDYISLAKKQYGARGKFYVSDANSFVQNGFDGKFDVIICKALLHHLDDDEVLKVLKSAKSLMHEKSRFICIENCFLIHQTFLSKWIISKDRGRNLRSEDEFKELFSRVFANFKTNIATGLLRIPYVHIIIECVGCK